MHIPALCPRCGVSLRDAGAIVSKLNLDCICFACKERETRHPRYAEADAAELESVIRGELNYPGLFEHDRAAIADLYNPPQG